MSAIDLVIACERSGVMREAFRRRGVNAYSCDMAPAEDGSPNHIQGDALAAIRKHGPPLVIAHPECRRLALSGVLRLYLGGKKKNGVDPVKWAEMIAAADFFRAFFETHKGKLCVENPRQHGHAVRVHGCGEPAQVIQPYQFGEDASKATCLWLRGLPPLIATHAPQDFFAAEPPAPRMVAGLPRYANQTDSGQNRLAPSPTRSMDRARTYRGIAEAMAEQWAPLLT